MIITATSCDTSNTEQDENIQSDDKGVPVATARNGKLITTVSTSKLRSLATTAYNKIPGKKTIEGSVFDSVFVQGSGNYYYIIGKGKDADGNCVFVATSLAISSPMTPGRNQANSKGEQTLTSGPIVPGESTTHSCSGDPCESCGFVKNSEGEITGCDCNTSNVYGNCNHTVTSG